MGIEQKGRDFSLDLIKALAIFMVCETHYLHLNESWIDNLWGITTCMGVPLFFMVNGALLFQKKIDVKKHYSKTFRIFILCILWKAISVMIVSWVKGITPFGNGISPVINYLLGYNGLDGYELGHFWFLYALIGIYIIFPVIRLATDEKQGRAAVKVLTLIIFFFSFGLATLALLLQIVGYYTNTIIDVDVYALNVFNLFGQYGYCVVWFVTGGFLYTVIREKDSKYFDLIIVFLFFIGWGLLFCINRFQNIVGYANGIVNDGYFQIPTFIMTISLFTLIVRKCKNWYSKFIVSVSKNSFSIYMLHMLVGLGFLKIQSIYKFTGGIFLNTIKAIYMLLGSWVIALVLTRVPIIKKLFKF